MATKKEPAHMQKSTTSSPSSRRSVGVWLVRNLILGVAVWLLLTHIPSWNVGYNWLWNAYAKQNLEITKSYAATTYDERQAMKLGADYQYLLYLRQVTPADAVIYWPTRADFQADGPNGEKSPFQGNLIDKLCAVRVLYPRRVITYDEWGNTSWAARTTHVAIVNGQNLDKLPYPTDSLRMVVGVLPMQWLP